MSWYCTLFRVGCLVNHLAGPATVHDGDTLTVQGQPVRLAGVDAEELDEPHGLAARDALRAIVAGRVVTCDWSGYSYQRVVGTCFVDGHSLNQAIIASGAALDCAHYSHGAYRSFEPAGARARLIQKPYC